MAIGAIHRIATMPYQLPVLSLRHEEYELGELFEALRAMYAQIGVEIVVTKVDPADAQETDAICFQHNTMDVALPKQQAIPMIAMGRGVNFLVWKDGQVMRLNQIILDFQPYQPRSIEEIAAQLEGTSD